MRDNNQDKFKCSNLFLNLEVKDKDSNEIEEIKFNINYISHNTHYNSIQVSLKEEASNFNLEKYDIEKLIKNSSSQFLTWEKVGSSRMIEIEKITYQNNYNLSLFLNPKRSISPIQNRTTERIPLDNNQIEISCEIAGKNYKEIKLKDIAFPDTGNKFSIGYIINNVDNQINVGDEISNLKITFDDHESEIIEINNLSGEIVRINYLDNNKISIGVKINMPISGEHMDLQKFAQYSLLKNTVIEKLKPEDEYNEILEAIYNIINSSNSKTNKCVFRTNSGAIHKVVPAL